MTIMKGQILASYLIRERLENLFLNFLKIVD